VESRFSVSVQTGSKAHPSSYTMGTGYFFSGVKRPGRGADDPFILALGLRMGGVTILPPVSAYIGMLQGDLYLYFKNVLLCEGIVGI
jgi:hypothetical protein